MHLKVVAMAAALLLAAGVITSDGDAPPAAAESRPAGRYVPTSFGGTYRVEVLGTRGMFDGQPYPARDTVRRYVIRSSCSAAACTARAVRLDGDGGAPLQSRADVELTLRGDHWVSEALVDSAPCQADPSQDVPLTVVWRLDPQPDGTLTGSRTVTEVAGGTGPCAGSGGEFETPVLLSNRPTDSL